MGSMTTVEVARIVTAVVFVGIGITHFIPPIVRGMAAMVPPVMRNRPLSARALVYLTGVAEIVGGLGLLWEPIRPIAAIGLAIFLVCVFPANAYAAKRPEKFGKIAVPFWPRLIMQIGLIALVLWVGLAP